MTFEEWLNDHEERIQKDLNLSSAVLYKYINDSDLRPIVDFVLWKMSAIYDINRYTYDETIEYLHSYIEMYRRDYDAYLNKGKSASNVKSSIVSKIISNPRP